MPKTIKTRLYRFVRWIASRRLGARIFSLFLYRVDNRVHQFSGGKQSIASLLAGLDSLSLTTKGARSGKAHTVPLIYFSDGPRVVVIASNWGRKRHPDWYYNLKAHPKAQVSLNGESGAYQANEALGDQRDNYWQRAIALYDGFASYEKWAQGRDIKIMVLTPTAQK